jgi:hypothetical protein
MAVADLLVKIGADIKGFQSSMKQVGSTIESSGQKLRSLGMSLTASVTAPIVGIGVAAFKASTDFNEAMANVATLIPGQTEKIEGLKDSVQDLSIELGKSTDELAGGLYQVISAFGDTADAMSILEINSKAAVAGLSTVEEAVNLTSAVTKAYGDTSAEAVQKVADLAMQTVVLGQTTFPELANAIGRVTPLAEAFNISQEELFGTFATLTGVTGNANQVSTQFRGILANLMKPSEEMASAIGNLTMNLMDQGKITGETAEQLKSMQLQSKELSEAMLAAQEAGDSETFKKLQGELKANGEAMQELAGSFAPAIIEMLGFQETVGLLTGDIKDNQVELAKLFTSIESMPALLALIGPQADTWAEKTTKMTDAAGSATTAFTEQTDGVNSLGHAWDQMQQKFISLAQDLGEVLIPAFNDLIDAMQPLIDLIKKIIDWFGNLDPAKQKMVTWGLAIAAAIGPALTAFGQIETTIGKVATALGSGGVFGKSVKGLPGMLKSVSGAFKTAGNAIWTFVTSPAGVWMLAIGAIIGAVTLIITHWEEIAGFFKGLWEGISTVASAAWEVIKGVLTAAWEGIIAAGKLLWDGFKNFFGGLWEGIKDTAAKAWEGIKSVLGKAWEGIKSMAKSIWGGISGFFGGIWDTITGKGKGAEIEAIKQEIGFDNYANTADTLEYHTVPELELPIFDTQSLNNFDADMGDLRANQIIMDIHDNKISDELDIEKIGDQLVHRLYRAGVA